MYGMGGLSCLSVVSLVYPISPFSHRSLKILGLKPSNQTKSSSYFRFEKEIVLSSYLSDLSFRHRSTGSHCQVSFFKLTIQASIQTSYVIWESCSFGLPRVPFVNCCLFMYLVISHLVLRAWCGIWLYQFLIIAYLFTLLKGTRDVNCTIVQLDSKPFDVCRGNYFWIKYQCVFPGLIPIITCWYAAGNVPENNMIIEHISVAILLMTVRYPFYNYVMLWCIDSLGVTRNYYHTLYSFLMFNNWWHKAKSGNARQFFVKSCHLNNISLYIQVSSWITEVGVISII